MRIILLTVGCFLIGLGLAVASWAGLSDIAYDPIRLAPATAFLAGFLFAFALHQTLNTSKNIPTRLLAMIGVIVAISLLSWSLDAVISKPGPPTGPVLPSDSSSRTNVPVKNKDKIAPNYRSTI